MSRVSMGGGARRRSARLLRRLPAEPAGLVGMIIIGVFLLVALTAPLLANDRPIVASLGGTTVFPAWASYVDDWVPWRSLRHELKSLRVGDGFPFSDHYSALAGSSWEDAGAPLEWAVWPPLRFNPSQFDGTAICLAPGERGHPLGTDDQGRDVLSRLVHGTVVALLVGVVSQLIAGSLGVGLGVLAGFMGGWVDLLLSRLTEVVICFPTFFLVIAVIAFIEPGVVNIMVVLGLVGWTGIFRLVRGETLRVRESDHVVAARATGLPLWRIMGRHVLPNAVSPALVALAFGVASAILIEAGLSFLGLGDPSVPSWGEIIMQGRLYVGQGLWHLAVFPGLAIFLTLLGFNLLAQALRDVMDPKQME